jgi:hypothetical protein
MKPYENCGSNDDTSSSARKEIWMWYAYKVVWSYATRNRSISGAFGLVLPLDFQFMNALFS